MIEVPSIDKLLQISSASVVILTVAGVGWFARHISIKEHIKDLRKFIDYLKGDK